MEIGQAAVISILLLLAMASACDESQNSKLRKLVGDSSLPLSKVHSEETIAVRLAQMDINGTRHLHIRLDPDNSLTISRYREEQPEGIFVEPEWHKEEEFQTQLSENRAELIRNRISIFRPPELTGDAPFIFPRDCGMVMHGFSKGVVEFSDPQRNYGLFILQQECQSPASDRLTAELREIVARLQSNEIVQNFDW